MSHIAEVSKHLFSPQTPPAAQWQRGHIAQVSKHLFSYQTPPLAQLQRSRLGLMLGVRRCRMGKLAVAWAVAPSRFIKVLQRNAKAREQLVPLIAAWSQLLVSAAVESPCQWKVQQDSTQKSCSVGSSRRPCKGTKLIWASWSAVRMSHIAQVSKHLLSYQRPPAAQWQRYRHLFSYQTPPAAQWQR